MSSTRDAPEARSVEPNTAWQQAPDRKLTAARLAQLPTGLAFDHVDEPIWYDEARKLLCYRGFMCNASYVLLRRLSDHPAYIAALEQLYLGSAAEEGGSPMRWVWKLAAPLAVAGAVAGAWLWLH
jgi:hypothetical protein